MRDEDHREAKRHGFAHSGEKVVGFLRSENGGGFVQNQDTRLAVEGFEDLDPLPLAHAEAADLCVGVHPQPVVFH